MDGNKQHVWHKQWCYMVPHTFLYYFEAIPMEANADPDGEDGVAMHEVWSGRGINSTCSSI